MYVHGVYCRDCNYSEKNTWISFFDRKTRQQSHFPIYLHFSTSKSYWNVTCFCYYIILFYTWLKFLRAMRFMHGHLCEKTFVTSEYTSFMIHEHVPHVLRIFNDLRLLIRL